MPKRPDITSEMTAPAVTTPKKSASAASTVTKAPKPRYVNVENKTKQVLSLSVINDDGVAEELKLGPLSTSRSIRQDRLTPAAFRLETSGRVRIR